MELSFSNIVNQVKELIINPNGFWEGKKESEEGQAVVLVSYLLPILLVVALAVFVGEFFRRTDFFIEYPLLKSLREILLVFLQYYVGVFFTRELMKTFGGKKDIVAARKLVAYSMTPMLLVSVITGLFQFLYVIDILGFYSFYLFWIGAKKLVKLPENKSNSYILITILINFFVFSFLSWFLAKILEFILLNL